MTEGPNRNSKKRSYPGMWDKFIPVAVILITAIIALLVFVTIRVALGMTAF